MPSNEESAYRSHLSDEAPCLAYIMERIVPSDPRADDAATLR